MNRRKTLALIGGGITFGSLYGVNSMTQPALAANVEITDSITITEDEVDNLAFEFSSFELTAANIDGDITVILQARLNNGDYIQLDDSVTLSDSSYTDEDVSNELGNFNLDNLDLSTDLTVGDEQEIEFKIVIESDGVEPIEKTGQTTINVGLQFTDSVVYGSHDRNAYIHDTSDWSLTETLTEAGDIMRSVTFSPDGSQIAYGSQDNNVYIHDTSDWSLTETLTEAGGNVNSVTFSPV